MYQLPNRMILSFYNKNKKLQHGGYDNVTN
jgi:hypothetical protein